MKRRDIILLAGCLAAGVMASRARAEPAIPAVGFLRTTPAAPFSDLLEAFRQGLKEEGFEDGRTVTVEQRWADNHLDRLPALAADLVKRNVAVIVGNGPAMDAARAATKSIPIVFIVGNDPIRSGLVTSIARPGGNLTGVTFFGGSELNAKRIELLNEVVPGSSGLAVLIDPGFASVAQDAPTLDAAGRAIGRRILAVAARDEGEFESAFAAIKQSGAGALLVSGSPLFTSHRSTLVALTARYAIPAIYDLREYADSGGLISYSASIKAAYRQAGEYAGKILKGAKTSELPIRQPTTFELVINQKTARALGLTLPQSILVRADEVIE